MNELKNLGSKTYVYEFLKKEIQTFQTYLFSNDLSEEWKRMRGQNSIVTFLDEHYQELLEIICLNETELPKFEEKITELIELLHTGTENDLLKEAAEKTLGNHKDVNDSIKRNRFAIVEEITDKRDVKTIEKYCLSVNHFMLIIPGNDLILKQK